MSTLSVGFIRSSIVYLLVGVTFGLIMAFPGGYSWLNNIGLGNANLAHAHSNLLGFMLLMVMGVAYHIFPRFTGNPLKYPQVAWVNFWGCVTGAGGMVLGFLFRGTLPWLLPLGGMAEVVGIACFAFNIFQVVKPLKPMKLNNSLPPR
jgi:hypothetical protein